jgi:hypothetical protein
MVGAMKLGIFTGTAAVTTIGIIMRVATTTVASITAAEITIAAHITLASDGERVADQ